jgi:predicted amidohydrolase
VRVSIVQLNSHDDVERNLSEANRLVRRAHSAEPAQLYILPEYTPFAGGSVEQKRAFAETVPDGPVSRFFSNLASELGAGIYCGSLNETLDGQLFNTSVIFDRSGELVATYRKLYLMDATLPGGRQILESSVYSSGREIVTFELGGARFACSICYDLRFPELFRAFRRRDVDAIIFAAAMPKVHAAAHLEVLLRARAIETQSFVLASHQCGKTANNTRESSGHSMIIDPWGVIEARLYDEVGYLTYDLDLNRVKEVRARMPLIAAADGVLSSGVSFADSGSW